MSSLGQFSGNYFSSANTKESISNVLFQIFTGPEEKPRSYVLLELVWLTISGAIDPKESANAMEYLLNDEMKSSEYESLRADVVSLLENTVWFWTTQTPYDRSEKNPSEQWKKLCVFTHNLFVQGVLAEASAKAVLPIPLLNYSLNLPEDEDMLNKKFTKIKTRLFFRQEKFNILREETEGYTKLIEVLSSLPAPPSNPDTHITTVFATVGQFDLDPNRVIDIVLDSFEHQLWNLSFISVLRKFPLKNVHHVVGFKFSTYHERHDLDMPPVLKASKESKDSKDPKVDFAFVCL